MKRVLSLLGLLALLFPALHYFHEPLARGSGEGAVFLSTARPALEVTAPPEFMPVSHGKMTVPVSHQRSLAKDNSVTVWYALQARENAQLVASLAEGDGQLEWYPGLVGMNLESLPILYSHSDDKPSSMTQRVFIRPQTLDPWTEAFAAGNQAWAADLLVSQYEWIVDNRKVKVQIEYREPWALGSGALVLPENLQAFMERAKASFSANFVGRGEISASLVTPWGWNHEGVSSRLLGAVLGSMERRAGD